MSEDEGQSATAYRSQRVGADSRPPEITRRITACEACRKQKIRCSLKNSKPPCDRCRKRGLPCTLNRSLQMLLENDVSWKRALEQRMKVLEDRVGVSANANSGSNHELPLVPGSNNATPTNQTLAEDDHYDSSYTTAEGTTGLKIVIDLESSPSTLPGHYIQSAAPIPSRPSRDLITRGVITIENARKYQRVYQDRLDHFLYGPLGDYSNATFEEIQHKSPILGTVVCAIGALHSASADYESLYREFIGLSAAMSFSKTNVVDDVRALCIGAFWMSDLSSSLVSLAVRIATELQLYRSFSKALQGDREHYSRARLYYLVYACDHHLSIPYGRPPITRECEAIRDVRKFLTCKHAKEDDARLVSQVLRWSVCTNVYDTFGADVDRALSDDDIPKVRRFSIALDNLRVEWGERFTPNAHVGNYPRKGVSIQYHFAKLYLFSHALRGQSSNQAQPKSWDTDMELYELANSAILSAVSILRAVVSDTEIQSFLNGLPTYFHVMIAFAVVFLLKMSTRFSNAFQMNVQEIQRLMSQLMNVLRSVSKTMHPRHLLIVIKDCLENALERNFPMTDTIFNDAPGFPHTFQASEPNQGYRGDLFGDDTLNGYFLNEYDFLVNHFQEPAL